MKRLEGKFESTYRLGEMIDDYHGEWLSYGDSSLEAEAANVVCWPVRHKNSVFYGQLFEDGGSSSQ